MDRVLITPRSLTSSPPPALARLERAGFELVFSAPGKIPDENELLRLVPDCVGWLAGVEPVSEKVIAAARRLRVISRNGSGVDSLPMVAVEARGIAVERALGANAT
ncbi:oxidoreductase, partial [Nitratireductor sp. GCM10026969]